MAFKKGLTGLLAGAALFGSVAGTSFASEEPMIPNAEVKKSDSFSLPLPYEFSLNDGNYDCKINESKLDCKPKKESARKREPFYFDEIQFTPLGRVSLDNKLRDFATNYASFHGTWFDFPLAGHPTRWFGWENSWPDKITWAWGLGNEAYATEKGVQQMTFNLSTEFRWYFNPRAFAGFGWQHHSFAGISNPEAEDYIKSNSIDTTNVNIRDIISLRFAHQFKTFNDKLSVEYFLARNLWEAYFSDMLSAEEKTHRAYNFPWAGGAKVSLDVGNLMDFSFSPLWEYSEKSFPNASEFAINFSSPEKEKGTSFFYRITDGVGKNKVRVGYHGLEMDGSIYGIKMFFKSF